MIGPISQGIITDNFYLDGPANGVMLFVIAGFGGIVGEDLQKVENLVALPSRRAFQLENLDRDQYFIWRQRLVLPFFAEFSRRNPMVWVCVVQACIHFAASAGITPMSEVDQISRQLVLLFLGQFRQFSFDIVQTHLCRVLDAWDSINLEFAADLFRGRAEALGISIHSCAENKWQHWQHWKHLTRYLTTKASVE